MKTITLCGSMAFMPQMKSLGRELETMGYNVFLLDDEEVDHAALNTTEQAALKHRYIDDHLGKIRESEAILVANYEKQGVTGHVGANTLMEIAFAYALGKQIFLLNALGEQGCKVEVLGLWPVIVNGNIEHFHITP